MLAKLKEATKDSHQNVEKVLVSHLKNLSDLEEYGALLLKLHNFYKPVEVQVHNLVGTSVLPDIESRNHINNLKSDLSNLGRQIEAAENPFSKNINSISYALGILYVMEGSTLGGQIICSMLKNKLPNIDDSVVNYFNSYGEDTPKMWNSFRNHIESASIEIDQDEMLKGARDTFENLRVWLVSN